MPCPRERAADGGAAPDGTAGGGPTPLTSRAHLLRQSAGFLFVGGVTTGAYLGLLLALEPVLGSYPANVLSVVVTSVANTAWNRRLSFGVRGSEDVTRHHVQGMVTCLLSLALTSTCIAVMEATGTTGGAVRSLVLLTANAAAGILHFLLLKVWVFSR